MMLYWSDSNVTHNSQVRVTFYNMITIALSVKQIVWYVLSIYVFLTEITAASICEGRRLSNIHNC